MNKRWETDGRKYELLFRKFNDEECVLSFCQDKDDPTCFWYVSKELRIECECEFADSIEEAKAMFEEIYEEYLKDEISYYEDLLDAWEEE